jgi:hypothetical protein
MGVRHLHQFLHSVQGTTIEVSAESKADVKQKEKIVVDGSSLVMSPAHAEHMCVVSRLPQFVSCEVWILT